MRIVVTGAAGFIGSHLVERLLSDGHEVVGVDCFLEESYPSAAKRRNLQEAQGSSRFTFKEVDLRSDELGGVLTDADAVVNEAAMPGLMRSWSDFSLYVDCNVLALQRIIEVIVQKSPQTRLVQISTSSVYGRIAVGQESGLTQPFSPYGVSKLAAENLVRAYVDNFDLNAVILRYFSVYGPRQRPDMAYSIFCSQFLRSMPVTVFGDGSQTRSNTYVGDAVDATARAIDRGLSGETYNVAGGETTSLLAAINVLGESLGTKPEIRFAAARPGDQLHTRGDSDKATRDLGWVPTTPVADGLGQQAAWAAAEWRRSRG